jgi:hypothetical protein
MGAISTWAARRVFYKAPRIAVRITVTDGPVTRYSFIRERMRAPCRIDPLPTSQTERESFFGGSLPRRITGLHIECEPQHEKCFEATVGAKIATLAVPVTANAP